MSAHWAQATLDVMWENFLRIVNPASEENWGCSCCIKKAYRVIWPFPIELSAFQSVYEQVNGSSYKVEKESFYLAGVSAGTCYGRHLFRRSIKSFAFIYL